MSEEHISETDEVLREDRPEVPQNLTDQRKDELIALLRHAADELGDSPTVREYDSLGLGTSSRTISKVFGTWNNAKDAAGLDPRKKGAAYVQINEDYFREIDSATKAYWLGTLIGRSSLHEQKISSNYTLHIGRVLSRRYFVEEFAAAIESGYRINYQQKNKPNEQDGLLLSISNPEFIATLIAAGYPRPNSKLTELPEMSEAYHPSFVRGYLESSGYFTTNGWQITAETMEWAEELRECFVRFGAKRPTTSEAGDTFKVRASNVFDIRAVFEACWPDQRETTPSWRPYSKKVLDHLEAEYPYPENLPYLS